MTSFNKLIKGVFMKLIVAALISVVAQASMASCLGEAQIIAQVSGNTKSLTSCIAHVDSSSIVQYNESGVCPLDLGEVLEKGVEVGMKDGHDCRLQAGDVITGVLVKNQAGIIVLE
jgi:hypothetical protein